MLNAKAPWLTAGSAAARKRSRTSSRPSPRHATSPTPTTTSGQSSPVIVTPAASRTVVGDATSGHAVSGLAIALFAVLLAGLSLILLPGVRRRIIPVVGAIPRDERRGGRPDSAPSPVVQAASTPDAAALATPARGGRPGRGYRPGRPGRGRVDSPGDVRGAARRASDCKPQL